MKKQYRKISLTFTLLLGAMIGFAQDKNVVDEIVWIVGDEAILKSEVENNIAMMRGRNWGGDPYCIVPEQLAVQKLFLHQATIDSVTVSTAEVMQYVEAQISEAIANAGSREKLEEYEGKSVAQLREMLREQFNDMLVARDVRKNLTNNIKVTPADVRRYFKDIPEDSIPYIPTQVEVQLLSVSPVIPQEEIDRVKTELRDYTDRVNRGESSFSTLARLYSEDKGSARGGGELGYVSRTTLVPAFANVAFSLSVSAL